MLKKYGGWVGQHSSGPGYGTLAGACEYGNKYSVSMKGKEFLD
jgi:hypothetical protein